MFYHTESQEKNLASIFNAITECVPLKISFHLYFSASLKFGACYITCHWGKFRVKNGTLYLHILLWQFFVVFHKKICFYNFYSFFWRSIGFPQQNINESETATDDKKLPVSGTIGITSKYNPHFDDYIKCKRLS